VPVTCVLQLASSIQECRKNFICILILTTSQPGDRQADGQTNGRTH